jgi:hypothetical protein
MSLILSRFGKWPVDFYSHWKIATGKFSIVIGGCN